MKVKVHVFRHRIVGGGTAYEVLVPKYQKKYFPITGTIHAMIYVREYRGKEIEYFTVFDFLRTSEIDELPPHSKERWEAFRELDKKARELEYKAGSLTFPELKKLGKMPLLWATWNLPNAEKEVILEIEEAIE